MSVLKPFLPTKTNLVCHIPSYLHLYASVTKQDEFAIGKIAVLFCSWEGNRRSCVSLAIMHQRLTGISTSDSWPKELRWARCLRSCKGVWHNLPSAHTICQRLYSHVKVSKWASLNFSLVIIIPNSINIHIHLKQYTL